MELQHIRTAAARNSSRCALYNHKTPFTLFCWPFICDAQQLQQQTTNANNVQQKIYIRLSPLICSAYERGLDDVCCVTVKMFRMRCNTRANELIGINKIQFEVYKSNEHIFILTPVDKLNHDYKQTHTHTRPGGHTSTHFQINLYFVGGCN